MKKFIVLLVGVILAGCSMEGRFSKSDLGIIRTNPEEILKIYTIETEEETTVLRNISTDLSEKVLFGKDYSLLAERMIRTVSDTAVGGVGLAAPQIGINRRIVVVQRFDKEGEPFEAYPNITIVDHSSETKKGAEGCLSVPGERYDVNRFTSVEICYFDIDKGEMVTETIEGFTAVIFQHEVDHLDGIIYTDRVLM